MKSTISLFKKIYLDLPPLFPSETKKKIAHALGQFEKEHQFSLSEIEDVMIGFGYEVWPWRYAYREFLAIAEEKVGEHFLIPKLTEATAKRYHDFKIYGGSLRDLHSGHAANFFTLEERSSLREALIRIQPELRTFTNHEVVGTEKVKYLKKVDEFSRILNAIKNILNQLEKIANDEQNHPTLVGEIRSRVRGFEYGLCLLGPELNFEEVKNSPQFFKGRKLELNQLRGINIPGTFSLED